MNLYENKPVLKITPEEREKLAKIRPDLHLSPDPWESEEEFWERTSDASEISGFMHALKQFLVVLGENPSRNGLIESPFRFAKAMLEYTKGYTEDPAKILGKSFDVTCDELVLVKDIPFNSLCEHHFAPFFGVAHIAYIPENNVITGLSKFARLTDAFAQRLQVQERLTAEIADTIEEVLKPKGTAVIIEATHYCMCGRGVKKQGASTTTSAMRGVFREKDAARAELLQLINR